MARTRVDQEWRESEHDGKGFEMPRFEKIGSKQGARPQSRLVQSSGRRPTEKEASKFGSK